MGYVFSRPCPYCKRSARSDATVCPNCTRDIPTATLRWRPVILLGVALMLFLLMAYLLQ